LEDAGRCFLAGRQVGVVDDAQEDWVCFVGDRRSATGSYILRLSCEAL
jgi:hypothetical protein